MPRRTIKVISPISHQVTMAVELWDSNTRVLPLPVLLHSVPTILIIVVHNVTLQILFKPKLCFKCIQPQKTQYGKPALLCFHFHVHFPKYVLYKFLPQFPLVHYAMFLFWYTKYCKPILMLILIQFIHFNDFFWELHGNIMTFTTVKLSYSFHIKLVEINLVPI